MKGARQTDQYLSVVCTCSHLSHSVSFWRVHSEDVAEIEGAHVYVSLDYEESWWRRFKVAWRYFWRKTCGYGDVAEIYIRPDDVPKIRAWLDHSERLGPS